MFCFCFRRSRFERIAITLQKVYLHCHSNKFSLHTIQISIQWDMIFYFEKRPNLQISCHRYSVPMEAALSTNHILKLSSRSDMLFHLVPFSCFFFFIHALQPTLWSIKHEGVRPWKMGASLLNASAPKTMVSELPIPTFPLFPFHKP